MSSLASLIMLVLEAVALILKWRLDPERLKRELAEKIDADAKARQQAFRKALDEGDEDAVSSGLADVVDRLRK